MKVQIGFAKLLIFLTYYLCVNSAIPSFTRVALPTGKSDGIEAGGLWRQKAAILRGSSVRKRGKWRHLAAYFRWEQFYLESPKRVSIIAVPPEV